MPAMGKMSCPIPCLPGECGHLTKNMPRWVIILALMAPAAAPLQQDVHSIIQQSVAATERDWKAAPDYDYTQRVRTDGGTRTSEVMMIEGSPYERLTQVNDKPLTPQQQAKEQQKLDQAIALRRSESPQERSRRIARYMKEREQDQLFMKELTRAFDFKLEGEQKLGGRDVYVLRATPRAGYQPPNMQAQALKGMEGTLWIDKATLQWVKVEAQVVHPVTIAGFLARVEPGTRFELEQMPINDSIWLPQHFAMKSRARIMFLVPHTAQDEETYWGYHRSGDR
jgi:hypothetical protein